MDDGRRPRLAVHLRNYAVPSAAAWPAMLARARARAADAAGIDEVLVSEHVVFGSELGDYARAPTSAASPAEGSRPDRTDSGSIR